MPRWQLTLAIDEQAREPLFLQIARALIAEVRRGRLKPGDALPGSRSLAQQIGVHRNTVLAAYGELEAEGWIRTERARGTFVSPDLPEAEPRRFAPPGTLHTRAGFDLHPLVLSGARSAESKDPKILSLASGVPDTRLFPVEALARAYRRAVALPRGRAVLDYGAPGGHPRLRAALAEMLGATRGLTLSTEQLVITRGSQMGLYLIARALIAPGDVVAVEALGYQPAWETFRLQGATLEAIPVDEEGLDVEALARLCTRTRLRAVYLTPHHHFPTTVTLTPARRLRLLQLARQHRFAVVEDDYDHEFHYDGRPILPLASADTAGVVIYVGTLSKLLAPGLRIGYVAAPTALVERLTALRHHIDQQGDHAVEAAVATLLEDGEVQRHARRVRRLYRARRDTLIEAIASGLSGRVTVQPPSGGLALWARAEGIDVDAWADAALNERVRFQPARRFAFDGRARPFMRLGFAAATPEELREAVRRMRAALDAATLGGHARARGRDAPQPAVAGGRARVR